MAIDESRDNINVVQDDQWRLVQRCNKRTNNRKQGFRQCMVGIDSDIIGNRNRIVQCRPLPRKSVKKNVPCINVGTTVGNWCVNEVLTEHGFPSTLFLVP